MDNKESYENLYEAASRGNRFRVLQLLNEGPTQEYLDWYSTLTKQQQMSEERFPYIWNVHIWNDRPVREAASKGHLEIVKILHEHKADIFACENDALKFAAIKGHVPVVEYLLKQKADINVLDDYGIYWFDNPEVIKLLQKHGVKLKIPIIEKKEEKKKENKKSLCCLWWHGH